MSVTISRPGAEQYLNMRLMELKDLLERALTAGEEVTWG